MNKVSKNQKGFTVIEGLLIVLLLVAIGAVGYMVYHNDHKTKTATVSTTAVTKSTKSTKATTTTANPYASWKNYTSGDGVYTISYPSNWVGDGCTSPTNACGTTAEVDDQLSPSADPSWQVVELNHNKTSLSPQGWFDSYENIPGPYACVYDTSSASINGYSSYFAEYFISPTANQCPSTPTTDTTTSGSSSVTGYGDYYTIVNNDQAVIISMTVQDGSNGTRDTVPLVSTFNEIAKSIKFNN